MHDIDSTRLETSADYEGADYQETGDPSAGEGEDTFEMPMTEADEEDLAAELLGVSSEEQMDQFLGGLFRKLKRGIGGASKFLSRSGLPFAGVLKGLAQRALPFVGGALGTAIPIPGVGTIVGSALGKAAGNLLQSETDHLEVEEREFQMAKRFVRLASQAVRQGARLPARINPTTAVNVALRNALQGLWRSRRYPRRSYYSYAACPPCPEPPPCPTCAQPLPAAEPIAGTGGAGEPSGELGGSEEFGDTAEGEDQFYETDYEAPPAAIPDSSHTGRWVRRGRKIIVYGT